jgi:hypothetical protein
MRWPAPRLPTIYREAPTKIDYAVRIAIVGVGLGTLTLNSLGDEQLPAARILEAAIGVTTSAIGVTRMGETAFHSIAFQKANDRFYAQVRGGLTSVTQFMAESRLGPNTIHSHACRVYTFPSSAKLVSVPPPELSLDSNPPAPLELSEPPRRGHLRLVPPLPPEPSVEDLPPLPPPEPPPTT